MNFFIKAVQLFASLTAQADGPQIEFEPSKFVEMLQYMGKGMLVIFVIIGVIIAVTMLINKVFASKK